MLTRPGALIGADIPELERLDMHHPDNDPFPFAQSWPHRHSEHWSWNTESAGIVGHHILDCPKGTKQDGNET